MNTYVDIPIRAETAAAVLFARLLRHGWGFTLSRDGDLQVVFGDDPPRLPQQTAMAHIARVLEEFKALVRAASDPSDSTTIH